MPSHAAENPVPPTAARGAQPAQAPSPPQRRAASPTPAAHGGGGFAVGSGSAEDDATTTEARQRTIREWYHSRPRQLVTSVPRIVAAVRFDTQWTSPLCAAIHTVVNLRRWFCVRCTIMQQAVAVAEVVRRRKDQDGKDGVDLDDMYDLTLDGSARPETLCCGWVLPDGSDSEGVYHRRPDDDTDLRGFGCTWSSRCALCVLVLLDAVTLGLPCAPCGYLGCGTALFGMQTRWMVRKKYRLKGLGAEDFAIMCCCPQCAVEQQARELVRHGLLPEPPGVCCMS